MPSPRGGLYHQPAIHGTPVTSHKERKPRTHPAGRICDHPTGCNTILSRYNRRTTCAYHTDPTPPRYRAPRGTGPYLVDPDLG